MYTDLEIFEKKNNELVEKKLTESIFEKLDDVPTRGITVNEEICRYAAAFASSAAKNRGRIILDGKIIDYLYEKFFRSDFAHNSNIKEIIENIADVFFYVRNETETFGDDFKIVRLIDDYEIIDRLFEIFDSSECEGTIDIFRDFANVLIKRIIDGTLDEIQKPEDDGKVFDEDENFFVDNRGIFHSNDGFEGLARLADDYDYYDDYDDVYPDSDDDDDDYDY